MTRPERGRAPRHGASAGRGVATAEAVVALPVLVLLFVALFYFRDLSAARHEAAMQARSCAWLYSAGNCRTVPPGCELETEPAVDDPPIPLPDAGPVSGIIDGLLKKALRSIFGDAAVATAHRDVRRPAPLGKSSVRVSSEYHLPCNLAPSRPLDVAKDAWRIWWGP